MSTPPILIVKRGSVLRADLDLARKAGVVVVVVKDPRDVRYMDPPLLPTTRLQAVANVLIREALTKNNTLYIADIKERLVKAMMADDQPKPPEGIAP